MTGEHTVTAAGGCGRDIADPPNCSDPDQVSAYDPTTADHGGVHTNCGILNKAGFLMTDGGDHPSGVDFIRVAGIGEEKVRAIYHASIFDLPETPSFDDFADHHGRLEGRLGAEMDRPVGYGSRQSCYGWQTARQYAGGCLRKRG